MVHDLIVHKMVFSVGKVVRTHATKVSQRLDDMGGCSVDTYFLVEWA